MRSPSGIAVRRASAFDATAQRVYEAPGLGGTFANLATIPCGVPAAYGKAFRSGGCVRALVSRIALVQSGTGIPGFQSALPYSVRDYDSVEQDDDLPCTGSVERISHGHSPNSRLR